MSNLGQTEERNEVLFAFHQACNDPTAKDIIDWVKRYPQFADDIREHAAILKEWADRDKLSDDELSDTELSRSRSRTLNALYNARSAATQNSPEPVRSFEQMMQANGTDVPKLARELDIARTVLAALVFGRMRAPAGNRLVVALMVTLGITADEFNAALQFASRSPRLGHAKADGLATINALSYEELIRGSNMSDERKQYWLSEE